MSSVPKSSLPQAMTAERVQALLLSGPRQAAAGQEPAGAGDYVARRSSWPRCDNCGHRDEATFGVLTNKCWRQELKYPEEFYSRVEALRKAKARGRLIDLCPPCFHALDAPAARSEQLTLEGL